jgi:hypothetical protein
MEFPYDFNIHVVLIRPVANVSIQNVRRIFEPARNAGGRRKLTRFKPFTKCCQGGEIWNDEMGRR